MNLSKYLLVILSALLLTACLDDDEELGSTPSQPNTLAALAQPGELVVFWGEPAPWMLNNPTYFKQQVQTAVFPQSRPVNKSVSLWRWVQEDSEPGEWRRLSLSGEHQVTYTLETDCRAATPHQFTRQGPNANTATLTYTAPESCKQDRLSIQAVIKHNDPEQAPVTTPKAYLALPDIRVTNQWLGQVGLFIKPKEEDDDDSDSDDAGPIENPREVTLLAYVGSETGRRVTDVHLEFSDLTNVTLGSRKAFSTLDRSCITAAEDADSEDTAQPGACQVSWIGDPRIPASSVRIRVLATAKDPFAHSVLADCDLQGNWPTQPGQALPQFNCTSHSSF